MDLPVELLDMVLQHLSKPELKHLRQTCKRLGMVSVPFLFDSIFISCDSLDQEHAALALKRFRNSIKSVVLCPLRYPKLIRQRYKNFVHCNRRRQAIPKHPKFDEHMDMGYKEYCSLQERAGNKSSWSRIDELLQRILMEAPCIYRVVITYRTRFKRLTDLELAKYCRWETCHLPREMHVLFRLTPLQSLETSRSPDIARAIFTIPPAGTRKIKELVMEPTHLYEGFFKIPIERFDEPSCFTFQVSVFMANLIKLRLDIDEMSQHGGRIVQEKGSLVRFLAQAVNLEYLALRFRHASSDKLFRFTLGGCQFPKLRILVLERVGVICNELLSFLANSPRLKHLVLERCWLNGYPWIDFLNQIKASGDLEALHIGRCSEGFRIPDYHRDRWHYFRDLDRDLQDFLLHDGPNPFGQDKMAVYLAQYADTPPAVRYAPPRSFARLYHHEYS